jgi:phenylacetate-CoA ligase
MADVRPFKSRFWGHAVLPAIYMARGEPVLERLSELKQSEQLAPDALRELQERKLARVLATANTHPFWQARFAEVGVDPARMAPFSCLERLPPLSRDDLRHLTQLTIPRLGRPSTHVVRQTAGSSGVPVRVFADHAAQAALLAARWRCLAWYGISPGDREARVWGRSLTTSERRKERIKDELLNRHRVGGNEVDSDAIDATLTRLARSGAQYMYGYASLILLIANKLEQRPELRRRIELQAAIVTAEPSKPHERTSAAEILGCPIAEEFGNSELDIVSFTCPAGSHHLQVENMLVEEWPGSENEHGVPEILLTDLENKLMPILRYQIGDRAKFASAPCSCGRTLPVVERLSGRAHKQSFIVAPDGRRVNSYVFDYFVDALVAAGLDLRQVQATQVSHRRIDLHLILPDAPGAREQARMILERQLLPLMGNGIEVALSFPDQIGRADGRKYELFEPLPEVR